MTTIIFLCWTVKRFEIAHSGEIFHHNNSQYARLVYISQTSLSKIIVTKREIEIERETKRKRKSGHLDEGFTQSYRVSTDVVFKINQMFSFWLKPLEKIRTADFPSRKRIDFSSQTIRFTLPLSLSSQASCPLIFNPNQTDFLTKRLLHKKFEFKL